MDRTAFDEKWNGMDARERDVWVAIKIMNWTRDPSRRGTGWRNAEDRAEIFVPQFTNNPGAAWEVVEKLRANGHNISIGNIGSPDLWWVNVDGYNRKYATMPEAVCKAALAALEISP